MQQVDSIRLQGRASPVSHTLTFLGLVLGVALSDLLSLPRTYVLVRTSLSSLHVGLTVERKVRK